MFTTCGLLGPMFSFKNWQYELQAKSNLVGKHSTFVHKPRRNSFTHICMFACLQWTQLDMTKKFGLFRKVQKTTRIFILKNPSKALTMVRVFDRYNHFDKLVLYDLPLKRTSVSILTLLNLFRGSWSEGLSPVLSIFKSFNFTFNTFFQIQKPLGSIQKMSKKLGPISCTRYTFFKC